MRPARESNGGGFKMLPAREVRRVLWGEDVVGEFQGNRPICCGAQVEAFQMAT